MIKENANRYDITVENKPGELVKLTKFLSDAGMNVSSLRVANLGSKATIQFTTEDDRALPEGYRKVAAE